MEIRRAVADDAAEIEKREKEYFSDPWSRKDIFSSITTEGGMCFVTLSDGELVGYVLGRVIAPEGEIYRIAVNENHRKRGIGYRLLSYALKCERGRGLETVFLEVRSKNAPAIALYSALGFASVGKRKHYYHDPEDDAMIMMLDNF